MFGRVLGHFTNLFWGIRTKMNEDDEKRGNWEWWDKNGWGTSLLKLDFLGFRALRFWVLGFRILRFQGLEFGVWGLGFRVLWFLLFLRTKLECLEEFWDTLQFYFEDLGLKWMKMMKRGEIENNGIRMSERPNWSN